MRATTASSSARWRCCAASATPRGLGLDIVGIYHSHPNAPAAPSQFDLDHAWPVYSYVIVSVTKEGAGPLRSWELREDQSGFDPEHIEGLEDDAAPGR